MKFYPENKPVPEKLTKAEFIIRPLRATDVELDYQAVVASREKLLKRTGGSWPRVGFTIEENLTDLERHQKEFLSRKAFAYTVVSLDETRVLGCVYIDPPKKTESDAVVVMWVRQTECDKGLDEILFNEVRNWISSSGPEASCGTWHWVLCSRCLTPAN